MIRIIAVILAGGLLLSLAAKAQTVQPPPTDIELMQSRTEAAEAQSRYLEQLVRRVQAMYEARLDTAMEWLKAAQSAESKTSSK